MTKRKSRAKKVGRPNIFLCIVDCLRHDYVTPAYMPWLSRFGQNHITFENYWGSSHCTDPSITHLLSGRHPDDLKLYSMMFGDKNYSIPEDVLLLANYAQEVGYKTSTITNLQRWYHRGSDFPRDTRRMNKGMVFEAAKTMMQNLREPWFVLLHTDDMHANYTGGTYAAAAKYTDRHLEQVARVAVEHDAAIFITSDHGEGLGQSGPDDHPILQHGFGLWEFLTHLPLVMKLPDMPGSVWRKKPVPELAGHDQLHGMIRNCINGEQPQMVVPEYVFQAGATPKVFHRGVVTRDTRQFVRATGVEAGEVEKFWIGEFSDVEKREVETALSEHCASYGIDYGDVDDEAIVAERLKGLGYFDDE